LSKLQNEIAAFAYKHPVQNIRSVLFRFPDNNWPVISQWVSTLFSK